MSKELPTLSPLQKLHSIWEGLLPEKPRRLELAHEIVDENLAHVEQEKSKHQWKEATLMIDGLKYCVLGTISDSEAIEAYLTQISAQSIDIMTRHFGSCYEAAESLLKLDAVGTGLLSNAYWKKMEKPVHFLGLGNHTVFLKDLGGQSIVIDLTARFYIDLFGQKMDVLVLAARSKEEAKVMLSEVYGDVWYDNQEIRG